MIPRVWRVEWTDADGRPQSLTFAQRSRARGFVIVKRAAGFDPRMVPVFN